MYFVARNNEKTGPFTLAQLREMWQTGAVGPQTLYWEEGMAAWQPLDRLVAAALLPGGPHPPPDDPPGQLALTPPPDSGGIVPADTALAPAVPEMPRTAYLSLIFALLGPFLMMFGHGIGFVPGAALCIAAIVCGHMARAIIRRSGDRLPGKGTATAGLVLGYGCVGLMALFAILMLAGAIFAITLLQWGYAH